MTGSGAAAETAPFLTGTNNRDRSSSSIFILNGVNGGRNPHWNSNTDRARQGSAETVNSRSAAISATELISVNTGR